MNLKFFTIAFSVTVFFSFQVFADPSLPETIKHPESKCIIKTSGGEYPSYVVKKKGVIIYSPKSDGIIKAVFSPSGKYIAFSGSEISGVDIGKKSYSVVVLDCGSEVLKGILKGFPSGEDSLSMSWANDSIIKYFDTASEKYIFLKIIPDQKGSFQFQDN